MPLEELARENELTKRLVEQLGEIAATLKEGRSVDAAHVAKGVTLLGEYRALHAGRLDHDLQPEARQVAMPGCFEHLDHIAADHSHEQDSVHDLREQLQGDRLETPEERRALGEKLERFAEAFYQDVAYEGDYPLSCLVATLPDEASARVEEKFRPSHETLVDIGAAIDRFLSETGPAGSSPSESADGRSGRSNTPAGVPGRETASSSRGPSCCGPVPQSLP